MNVQRLDSEENCTNNLSTSAQQLHVNKKTKKQKKMHILKEENKWITGTILGDSYIDIKGRLNVAHSLKQQDYVDFKLLKLSKMQNENITAVTPGLKPSLYSRKDNRTGNTYTKKSFWSLPIFIQERSYFYSQNIKHIPCDLDLYMNAESLAFWFMDDGSRNSSFGKGMVIDVSSFVNEDHIKLQQILFDKFMLETSLHYRKGSSKNIKLYIKARSAQRFSDLVKPYLLPSFYYKLTC